MPRTPARTSRASILERTLALVADGGTVSLDTAARAAGLTKPGLMYHFPTKEALMTGLVDHVVDRYEAHLTQRLPGTEATPEERMLAYLDWAFTTRSDASELVAFVDPRLRAPLAERWAERMRPLVAVPDDLAPERRARLLAARLLGDGNWWADASAVLPLSDDERTEVHALARTLVLGSA